MMCNPSFDTETKDFYNWIAQPGLRTWLTFTTKYYCTQACLWLQCRPKFTFAHWKGQSLISFFWASRPGGGGVVTISVIKAFLWLESLQSTSTCWSGSKKQSRKTIMQIIPRSGHGPIKSISRDLLRDMAWKRETKRWGQCDIVSRHFVADLSR